MHIYTRYQSADAGCSFDPDRIRSIGTVGEPDGTGVKGIDTLFKNWENNLVSRTTSFKHSQ